MQPYLTASDPLVGVTEAGITLHAEPIGLLKSDTKTVNDVKILRDTKTIEVFINGGEESFTYWFDNN